MEKENSSAKKILMEREKIEAMVMKKKKRGWL
jgi:hypothetical protein